MYSAVPLRYAVDKNSIRNLELPQSGHAIISQQIFSHTIDNMSGPAVLLQEVSPLSCLGDLKGSGRPRGPASSGNVPLSVSRCTLP